MSLTNMGASNSEETHRERAGQVVECWQSAGTTLELEGTVRTLGCGESLGGVYLGVTQPSSSVKNLLWGLLRDGHMKAYRLIVYLESAGRRWAMLKCEGEEGSRVTPRF